MGTITRTFANNITTSGVFKPTAFNNASFDNVTAVPEGALPAGGSMVLLSTQTASGDASISFTSGITSTYKEYMFIFNNIHPEIKVNKISPRSGTTLTLGDSGDDFVIPVGATLTNNGTASGFASIAWQSSIVTGSTLTAVAGNGYWIDTTSNACTITLPASASVGDQIIFVDYARKWGTNAITINTNSLNFQGNTSPNPEYNTDGQSVTIIYSGATQGWIPTVDDDVTLETPQSYTMDYLVIAGGAGGGGAGGGSGGGGGAGGYRASYNSETSGGGGSSETALTVTPGIVYTITVGAGGSGGTSTSGDSVKGGTGGDSTISGSDITDVTSLGGGGGGGEGSPERATGGDGGSGGGAGDPNDSITVGSGTANQGFDGGISASSGDDNYQQGGGGGGAGAVGANATSTSGGNGGTGVASTITGSSITRAGGGGGGRGSLNSGSAGAGGTGGGGAGSSTGAGNPGTANTGGGGGGKRGGGAYTGGAGGSGVVILRVPTASYSGTTTGSPTVTTDGTDTIMTFTGSGSYTA
jgi:hypothetical protein